VYRRLLRPLVLLLILVLVLAAGATAVLTSTGPGRDRLAGFVSTLASSPDRTVQITHISGLLSGGLRIDDVVVKDRDGAWLTLRGVEVDWSPLALLGGSFSAERIRVSRVDLARLPLPPREAPPPSDKPFALPLSIDVAAIDLPRIVLAEAVAGAAATLSASGAASASDAPLRFVARFGAERTDGRPARIEANLDFAPDENRLMLEISGSEPEGGVLAGLLRLDGDPSVDITLSGEGPLADWRAKGALTVAGRVVTTLSASHREMAEGRRVAASGEGDFARFLPPDLAVLAAGSTMFDLAGLMTPSGGLVVEHAVLESDSISADAAGAIDPGGASDLTVRARAQDEQLLLSFGGDDPAVISFRSARLAVRGSGAAPAVDATIDVALVQAAGFGVADLVASLSSEGFDIDSRAGAFALDLKAAGVGAADPALAPFVAGPLEARVEGRLDGERLAISSGILRNRQVGAGFAGEADLATASATIDVKAELRSRALPEAARGVLGDMVALSGRIARGADGSLDVSGLTLASGPLSAQGFAKLADARIDARLSGGYAELSALAPEARGSVAFDVTASGNLLQPDLALTVTSDRIESAGRAMTGLALKASGKADMANPTAEISLKGAVEGEAIEGRAVLRSAGGASRVEDLLVSVGRNRISGVLDLDGSFTPAGTLTLDLPDLGSLAAMALEDVTGALAGSIIFRNAGTAPEIAVSATIERFARGELNGRDIAISATVADYRRVPAIAGRIRAAAVNSGETAIRGIDVTLTRDGEWTGFSGGATVTDIPASAEGRVRLGGSETTVELRAAKGAFRGVAATLARPTAITIRDGTTRLQGMALSLAGGTAEISGAAGAALDLDLRLAGVQASVVNAFAPGLGAAGVLSGTVKVDGPASNPRIGYGVDWRGATTAQLREAGFGALNVESQGTFAAERLTFTANAADGGGLGLKGGGTVNTAGAVSLDLKFDGAVPFSFLTRRLAEQGLSLSGGAEFSLAVSGAAGAPVIAGTVRSAGARFVDANSGIAVNDLAADIALGGGSATIRSITGTLSTGGSLTASGTVGIDPAGGFPADLAIRIADGRYTDGRVVTANFGGEMKVTGPLTGAPMLTGRVALGRTVITVPDRLPASLATLAVTHRNAPQSVTAQAEAMRPAEASGGQGGLRLDVNVDAPQQIFIQGRGIDAEFGGNIRLTGPAAAPVAIGQFTMRRGRLSILGKRLDFSRGTLGFQGSLIPRLDFAADTTASDATATISVSGEANNPRFGFTSSPSLPEDEVLARLIFGRSLSNLSPMQIAQLASAAAQLAGIGGSTSLLDRLRGQIGVDDIDIKTDEATGRTSVAVGKYLNDRTYVGIEKGEGAGSGKARIDLSIGRGVKLRGEASDDGKAKGGIFFEREY
jgi:translocation and assembly module TamB